MNILLTGADGQVGTALRPLLAARGTLTAIDRLQLDLADTDAVRAAVRALRPGLIVNAAAYTAVDRAETEPDVAHAVNAVAPAVLAEEAARLGARLVHYSTDYVYDGAATRPYVEGDATGPLGVYGRTKLAGDEAVLASGASAVILRTSWVYGAHGLNFLKTMLRLASDGRPAVRVVADQRGTPTSAVSIADATAAAIDADVAPGTYHLTDAGETTWHGFAQAIFRAAGLATVAEPIPTADYPTPAARPAYSVMDGAKWDALGVYARPRWEDALARVLADLGHTTRS